jgi:UDPglucose--hexose-1-phosphate uridylyltransferase
VDKYVWSATDGVADLIVYALKRQLIDPDDVTYCTNLLLDALALEPSGSFVPTEAAAAARRRAQEHGTPKLQDILAQLLDDACARGVIDSSTSSRDLLDTRLMGCVTPRPHEVISTFWRLYETSPSTATDWFYRFSQDTDYIRTYRIARDKKWTTQTRYGELEITINLSKPEKDPHAIAAALERQGQDAYPRCVLCAENEGFAGRLERAARQTIRLIPLTLAGETWYLQYSPYVYYNEHCIVLSQKHTPMVIDRATFERLFAFVEKFPHYTIGSNADLPIVGGSILTHEHFQGGHHVFPMARAHIRKELAFPGFPDVTAGIVDWPMSVIRLNGKDPARLVDLADKILVAWRGYSDASVGVQAQTDGVPHNTITPIARMRGEAYELDLVLRNNRTSKEHPLGIFHPHEELHHIKRENIGLIEVMGLAVLPARLLGEMSRLADAIIAGEDLACVPEIASHAPWAKEILATHSELAHGADREQVTAVLRDEIGQAFSQVLEQCAVFADDPSGTEAFARFIAAVAGEKPRAHAIG